MIMPSDVETAQRLIAGSVELAELVLTMTDEEPDLAIVLLKMADKLIFEASDLDAAGYAQAELVAQRLHPATRRVVRKLLGVNLSEIDA